MVAGAYGVARQAQDVLNAQHVGRQEIALDGDAVAVSTCDLKDGLQTALPYQGREGERANAHVGARVVGEVYGVHQPAQDIHPGQGVRHIHALGRIDLRGNDEVAGLKNLG